jgi:hypothetical protein
MEFPEIRLSDGRTARYTRLPKVIDVSRAHRQAGSKASEQDVAAALIAPLIEIDGQRVVYEDVMQMTLGDFKKLNEAFPDENFT